MLKQGPFLSYSSLGFKKETYCSAKKSANPLLLLVPCCSRLVRRLRSRFLGDLRHQPPGSHCHRWPWYLFRLSNQDLHRHLQWHQQGSLGAGHGVDRLCLRKGIRRCEKRDLLSILVIRLVSAHFQKLSRFFFKFQALSTSWCPGKLSPR